MFLRSLRVFVPLTILLALLRVHPAAVFICACVAIVPLADLLAEFTEQLSEHQGRTLGGLLNAMLGNAPELIIGGFTLSKGLPEVVKASISGSILMNLLLSLGISMTAGGLRHRRQAFNRRDAGMAAVLLSLAAIALIVPAGFRIASPAEEEELSFGISLLLLLMYLLSVVFTLTTQAQPAGVSGTDEEAPKLTTGAGMVLAKLGITAALLALISEIMSSALEPAIKTLGWSELFTGVIVLASLGNIAELIAAVRFARVDKMDLAIGTTVGSATQVALGVAPILVIGGQLSGQHMNLLFSPFEVIAVALAVVVISPVIREGESSWIEGAMLVAVYLVFSIGFYFLGPTPDGDDLPQRAVSAATVRSP